MTHHWYRESCRIRSVGWKEQKKRAVAVKAEALGITGLEKRMMLSELLLGKQSGWITEALNDLDLSKKKMMSS